MILSVEGSYTFAKLIIPQSTSSYLRDLILNSWLSNSLARIREKTGHGNRRMFFFLEVILNHEPEIEISNRVDKQLLSHSRRISPSL